MRAVAQEERAELKLGPRDPLDPYDLAAEHGIPVYEISQLAASGASAEAIAHFTGSVNASWSAALVPLGSARIIVENETHLTVRRRSNIAHELGHHLLEHPFQDLLLGDDHKRQFSPQQEKEALFLSGELLLPMAAVERMAFSGWSNAQVAEAYGVSEQFAQMQMKGQRVRARRAAEKWSVPH